MNRSRGLASITANVSVSFVEDLDNNKIHVWVSLGAFDLGLICEKSSDGGGSFVSLDATEIQEEWLDRLCPVCFLQESANADKA